jgi:hypothetical protein
MKAPIWLFALLGILLVGNAYSIVGTLEISNTAPGMPFAPGVRIALSIVWIVVLSGLLIGIVRKNRIAFISVAPLLTLYGLAGLIWNAVFEQSTYSRGSQPFDVLVTIVILAPIWWVALRRGWLRTTILSRGTD